jgi:hypothetical protein
MRIVLIPLFWLTASFALAEAPVTIPPQPLPPQVPTFEQAETEIPPAKTPPPPAPLAEEKVWILEFTLPSDKTSALKLRKKLNDAGIPAQIREGKTDQYYVDIGPEIDPNRLGLWEKQMNIDPRTVTLRPFGTGEGGL